MGEEEKDKQRDNDTRIEVEIKNDNTESSEEIDRPTDDEETVAGEESGSSDGEEEIVVPNSLIEGYEEKLKEKEDRFLRLAAEFDNYKKRTARQFENMTISSVERVITPLLEVVDNFQRALDSADRNSDFESLKKGMELIYQQLQGILEREGVEEIEAVGKPFDPNLHDAMMQVASDEYGEGIVVQEMMKGYRIKDKVIRHARVVVSKGAPEDDNSEQE